MNKKDFNPLSLLLTLLVHGLLMLLLMLVGLDYPVVRAESGVPVMLGDMGSLENDYQYTEVASAPAAPKVTPSTPAKADPVITQDMEETVAIDDGQKKPVKKPDVAQKPEEKKPTEAELRAERERQAQADAANMMANLFNNNNSQSTSPAESDQPTQGVPGSVDGNSDQGKTEGVGSYGTWDLNGRGMMGELPKPDYSGIQDEGRVVVTITVDPDGNVVAASINNRTNTVNQQLRDAAITAARKTRFNKVDGVDMQTGTIIYYFKLK